MKILIIGAKGTIGKYITSHYSKNHEVINAGRREEEYPIDISDADSIKKLFEKTGKVDVVICAAGEAKWGLLEELTEEDFHIGIRSKMMGQVNLVRIGLEYLNEKGSITLTTGILADDPVVKTASAAMVNGAIHSFTKAAALEMPPGKRLNVVSTGVVEDAYEKYKNYFPGHPPIPMKRMLLGYIRSVEGKDNGRIIRIYE